MSIPVHSVATPLLLAHPAARSLCDSWATCLHLCMEPPCSIAFVVVCADWPTVSYDLSRL